MQYATPIPLSIPTLGMDRKSPSQKILPEKCAWALNWEFNDRLIKVRSAYRVYNVIADALEIAALESHGTTLYAYSQEATTNKVYNVSAQPEVAQTTASLVAASTALMHSMRYAGRLLFHCTSSATARSVQFDGSTWTELGLTYGGLPQGSLSGITYKSRVYFGDNQYVYFGDFEAIAGVMTRRDFSTLWQRSSDIGWMEVLSSSTGNSEEQFFCIGSKDGEVLVFAGDNPDALNWELVGRFDIGSQGSYLLSQRQVQKVKNDIFIITPAGIVSVRRLFNPSPDDVNDIFITDDIRQYWRKLHARSVLTRSGYYSTRATMAFWPSKNRLYVLLSAFIDADENITSAADGGATMLVCNLETKAWHVHKIPIASSPTTTGEYVGLCTYHNEAIYYVTGLNVIMKYTDDLALNTDEDPVNPGSYSTYDIELHSGYTNFNSLVKTKKVVGFDLIVNSGYSGSSIGMKAASDMGRKVSERSVQSLLDGFSNPFYNVGVNGQFVQWRIDGDSESGSDIFELHSVGVSLV